MIYIGLLNTGYENTNFLFQKRPTDSIILFVAKIRFYITMYWVMRDTLKGDNRRNWLAAYAVWKALW